MSGVEVTYEVWVGGIWVASSDSEGDGRHYLLMYSQDGPATLYRVETKREAIATMELLA